MENFTNLLEKVKQSYPNFTYKTGAKFAFRPPKTIIIGPYEPHSELVLLHELGHAIINKNSFKTDVERLKIESIAWEKAKSLCQEFNQEFDSDFAESELDSYRDWLHQKSTCKKCGLTRFETTDGKYHCPHCD
ncbi:hypothetical protein IJF86_01320 [Candidatus Saccharibacteria bacterium]|nr:hypothetical protein [Candidatus Saccharibacteria bacterium]